MVADILYFFEDTTSRRYQCDRSLECTQAMNVLECIATQIENAGHSVVTMLFHFIG